MLYRRWLHALSKGALAGTVACVVVLLVFAALSAVLKMWWVGTVGGTVSVAASAGVLVGVLVHQVSRLGPRKTAAGLAAVVVAAATVFGIGPRNPAVTSVGLSAACELGLGECLQTGLDSMPLVIRDGAVQKQPVIRLVLWGDDRAQEQAAEAEERRAGALAQPLLRDAYGVDPAIPGGVWRMPSTPQDWVRAHHEPALTASDVQEVVRRARQAKGWLDSPDTQWWLVMNVSSAQSGIGAPGCADHVHMPGIAGVVVRLALRSCALPAPKLPPAADKSCSPVADVGDHVEVPETVTVGVELLIVHEYVEAATDPRGGWQVLVGRVCDGYSVLEIADVCARSGPILSAPVYDTPAGWQPSILRRPDRGRPARCVDPAQRLPGRPSHAVRAGG